jgi:hypothetical protein
MDPFIDRETAINRLRLAEKQVIESQRRVDAQLALVATLVAKHERDRHSVKEAERLLRLFEQLLALQVERRDLIAKELDKCS